MAPSSPALPPTGDDFHAGVESLATAIEQREPLTVEEAPATRPRRQLYWMVAGACALLIGLAEAAILLHDPGPGVPPADAAVTAMLDADPCAQRLNAIMQAIDAYVAARGALPPSLDALHPDFLAFPPVDPLSQAPYGYAVAGEGVTLSCPSAPAGGA